MESKMNLLNSLLRSSEYQSESNEYEAVTEVKLDSLTVNQHLLIQTAGSTYSFAVTDPVQRFGVLAGGELGERRTLTFLAGTRSGKSGVDSDSSRLRVGSRAIFLLSFEGSFKRLITSTVNKLVQKRARVATEAEEFEDCGSSSAKHTIRRSERHRA